MRDISLSLMTGIDIPIEECQLILHQPTIKEISYIGELRFFTGLQLLTINNKMLYGVSAELQSIHPFVIFLQILNEDKEKKQTIRDLFALLFQSYKIVITPRSINFLSSNNELITTLDENNFSYFQSYIQTIFCLNSKDNIEYNPGNEAAQEIANKLYRARQRVAAQKEATDKKTLSAYISSLAIAVPSMSLMEVINLTLYQLYDLLERYNLYIGWDLNIKCRLAGATDTNNENENWMKNIH